MLDPSCLLCPTNDRTCVEKFASPKLDGKVVCSLLHKAVLQLDEQQLEALLHDAEAVLDRVSFLSFKEAKSSSPCLRFW